MRYSLKNKNFYLSTDNFIVYENYIFFSEIDCNEVYCYDLKNDSTVMVCKFDAENEYQRRLFGDIIIKDRKLYMVPFSAKQMYEVDIATGNIKGIEIKIPDKNIYPDYNDNAKFLSGIQYKNSIYLVGTSYPSIVEYNCLTGKIEYYSEWTQELCQYIRNDRKAFFRKALLIDDKIYAPSCKGNFVLIFDLKTKQYQLNTVGNNMCSYSAICRVDDWVWLSPQGEGAIVKWNIYTNQYEEYWNFPDKYVPRSIGFGNMVYFDQYIYCIPINVNMLVRIPVQGGRMEECKWGVELTRLCSCVKDHKLFLFSHKSNQLIVLNKKQEIQIIKWTMPKEQKDYHLVHASHILHAFADNGNGVGRQIIQEQFDTKLKHYIDDILTENL